MTSGLSANRGDASLQTLAMLILLGCILVSAVVWFAMDGMRSTAIHAMASVAAQKMNGTGSTGGATSSGASGHASCRSTFGTGNRIGTSCASGLGA